jgi:N-acyl-D-amino-acid deacylase
MIDYLIINGSVIDGSGSEAVQMNVGIQGSHIAYLGPDLIPAIHVIDATRMVVCPGFIDTHAHSEFTLLADGRAQGKLAQGVTTEINGNCGLSAAPLFGEAVVRREADQTEYGVTERWSTFEEYFECLEAKGLALNFVTLCGHGNIRASVMGYRDGEPTNEELAKMKGLLINALDAGAKGLTTGLIYPPGVYSKTEEIIELAKAAVAHEPSVIYATHMRSEGAGLIGSIEEAIRIGRESGAAVHISHIKTSGEENWGKIDKALELIEKAQASGIKVTCDRYPYIASSTDLDTIIPSWAYEGGVQEELKRLGDHATREKIVAGLMSRGDKYWKGIYISSVAKHANKWMEGENIFDIARKKGGQPADVALDIIIDEGARAGAIFFSMCEENLRRFLMLPFAMIGSDSSVRSFSGNTCAGKPHPRGFGSFPRFLGRYIRDEGIIGLSEAIRKITSLPAEIFGLEARGVVKKGYFADLVVFDYSSIADRASFKEPFQLPQGIRHVFVNGVPAFNEGSFSETMGGRIIK